VTGPIFFEGCAMILIQSSLTGKPDTIVGLACDATGDGLQSAGFKSSLSDAIFAMPIYIRTDFWK
jgi:hypothetical protein